MPSLIWILCAWRKMQKYFALQLIFQFVGVLQVEMLSALGRNQVIIAVATFNFLSNIALNYLLMVPLGLRVLPCQHQLSCVFQPCCAGLLSGGP